MATLIGCIGISVLIVAYVASIVYRAHEDPYDDEDDQW
jgi:hypothetical protein